MSPEKMLSAFAEALIERMEREAGLLREQAIACLVANKAAFFAEFQRALDIVKADIQQRKATVH
jgi:hypothetical protein